jgi:predicted NAD/FAD-binding protein
MQQVGNRRPQVAVIGAGISGLGAAYRLAQACDVSVFEAATVAGGHAHTVDVRLGPHSHPVDVGFLVYNHRTYPRLMALFRELRVVTVPSNMTFSVSIGPQDFEWCGNDLGALFAQPSNALRPRFWRMLADMLRFNREATALARASTSSENTQTLGDFLRQGRYSEALRDDYLLPMAGPSGRVRSK